jgi:hypothetical protein
LLGRTEAGKLVAENEPAVGYLGNWNYGKPVSTGWKKIRALAPLKRAIILSELLGPPGGHRRFPENEP